MNAENVQVDSNPDTDSSNTNDKSNPHKIPYIKPQLTYHGDLRSLTLFGSFDSKDSGLGSDLVTP